MIDLHSFNVIRKRKIDFYMCSVLKHILGNASWILTGEDTGIDLPGFTSPKSPFGVVFNFAARVWMNEYIENTMILHGPSDGSFIMSFGDEERVLSGEERSSWEPVDLKWADVLKMGCWITSIDCAVLLVPELELIIELSLERHSLLGVLCTILPEKNMDVVRHNLGGLAVIRLITLRDLNLLLGCHQRDETCKE